MFFELPSGPTSGREHTEPLRALFLLLLLANLLFAAWEHWVAPPSAAPGRTTPSAADTRAIRLLREGPVPERSADATAASGTTAEAAPACVSAGPYLERPEAEAIAARLQRLGFAVRLRESRDEVRVGHWVRIEDLATAEDAANALAALQAAGIADAYVLAEEESPGSVVSVGVFTDMERAEQAAAAVRGAGFEPRTVARLRTADVLWLDIDREASAGLPSPEQLQRADAASLPRIELRACPGPERDASVP